MRKVFICLPRLIKWATFQSTSFRYPPRVSRNFPSTVSVVPNPTSDGHVRVQVELAVDAPLDMTLYTLDGAKVSSVSMKPDTYFAPRIHLPTPGVYLLTLKSGTNEKTVKLMRK